MARLLLSLGILLRVSAEMEDLLFIDEGRILELPSFAKATCNVTSFPENLEYIPPLPTGIVSNTLFACNIGCWLLNDGNWSPMDNLTTSRWSAGSSNSSNGWFLTGGRSASPSSPNARLKSTEVLVDGVWEPGPDLNTPLDAHCQVQVDQRIFVIGGISDDGVIGGVYSLDGPDWSSTSSWTVLNSLQTGRYWPSCVHREGLIYVMGGSDDSFFATKLNSTEIYNVTSGTWSYGPSFDIAHYYSSAILYQQDIYVVGGIGSAGKVWRLNVTNQWEEIATTATDGLPSFYPSQVIKSNSCGNIPITTTTTTTTATTTTTTGEYCCPKKEVVNTNNNLLDGNYTLVRKADEKDPICKDSCVYKKDSDSAEYCFKAVPKNVAADVDCIEN